MLRDYAPERARIGSADRLAFVKNGRAPMKQRSIDDVGMPDSPAEVGGGPEDFAGVDAVDVLHAPLERDEMTAVVAHHAFRMSRRSGGIKNVERIGGVDRHTNGRRRVAH